MKLLKKVTISIVVIIMVSITLLEAVTSNRAAPNLAGLINVGVVFYRFDDPYVVQLKERLENLENKNKGKIKFNFYDSKNNEDIQNQNLDSLLESEEIDVLILSLVDLVNDPKEVIDRIKNKNIPVIFASKRILKVDENVVKSYDKAYYVLPDSEQAGRLQGQMLANIWNKNKNAIDINKDEIMQYVILQGGMNNTGTNDRTKYSIMTIKDEGTKVEQLASVFCNWEESLAREAMEGLLVQYGNKIEVVIANNDTMAVGSVKALQKFGYNKDDNTRTIPVVGIDAIPESLNLIKNGYMTGTVLQDPDVMAEAFFKVIMHLVGGTRFDCSQEYKCDESGRIIRLPFKEYTS
ncbi:galactose ABC transporter substrate-binding protein [Clostridium sp. BL-8]|uniref:galactose ABC transporter substrate-binding protein n=1 Tax=Clostridium sp. BL-8 TaxID=349938 RepID=UPI00098C365A|nr:galactose ABC transporter substrate-binding protein [Clostridium sp. BL-8]OOM76951.1 D-galactose-binding periplasmic protein precursor [Clostridium sp. BL-8]